MEDLCKCAACGMISDKKAIADIYKLKTALSFLSIFSLLYTRHKTSEFFKKMEKTPFKIPDFVAVQ